MKKRICFLLASIVLLGTVSCGKSTEDVPTETTQPPETTFIAAAEPTRLDELGTKQFGGKTFRILDANDHPDLHINHPGEELNGETINDALYNRDLFMESTYGISMEYEVITPAKTALNGYNASAMAGDQSYSLIFSCVLGGALDTSATKGTLANLCETPFLSLDQNWWSPLIYDSLRLNDTMFFSTGDISPNMYQMPGCMFLNLSLMETLNIDINIYEQVILGNWTFDVMHELISGQDRDVDGDGVMNEKDFYGYLIRKDDKEMTYQMFVGADIPLSERIKTETGESLHIGFESEQTHLAAQEIAQLFTSIRSAQNSLISSPSYAQILFMEDNALLYTHKVESAYTAFREMESDFLILPLPKMTAEQDSYRSMVSGWVDAWVAIPRHSDQDFSGFITEALAAYSRLHIRPQAYEMTYKMKAARTKESAEILDILFDTLYFDFNNLYNFGSTMDSLHAAVWDEVPLASTLRKRMTAAQSQITDFIKTWHIE